MIDFFCGMGGASLGYVNSGNEVILAIDKWEDTLLTHKYNLPDTKIINCDISQLNLDELPYADLYHLSPHVSHSVHQVNKKVLIVKMVIYFY